MSHARNPFAPPCPDRVERVASALSFALFLGAWVVAYVGFVPADHPTLRRVAQVEVVR